MRHLSFRNPPDWLKWTGVIILTTLLITALLGAAADPLPLASFLGQSGFWLTAGVFSLSILILFFGRNRESFWKNIWFMAGWVILFFVIFISAWDKILLPIYHWLYLSRFETWLFPALILAVICLLFSIPALWRGENLERILEKFIAFYLSFDSQGLAYEYLRRLYYQFTGNEPAISARYVKFLGGWIGTRAQLLENTLIELEIQSRLEYLQSHGIGSLVITQKTIQPEITSLIQKTCQYRQILAFHIMPDFLPDSSLPNALTSALLWLENRAEVGRVARRGIAVAEKERRSLGEILQKCNSADLSAYTPIQQYLFTYLKRNEKPVSPPFSTNNETPSIETLMNMKYEEDKISQKIVRLALQTRLAELSEDGDYQALAQFGNRFLKTPQAQRGELSSSVHRFIGLAWWDQARHFSTISSSDKDTARELVSLSYQKATQHWMSARWTEALDVLEMPEGK